MLSLLKEDFSFSYRVLHNGRADVQPYAHEEPRSAVDLDWVRLHRLLASVQVTGWLACSLTSRGTQILRSRKF